MAQRNWMTSTGPLRASSSSTYCAIVGASITRNSSVSCGRGRAPGARRRAAIAPRQADRARARRASARLQGAARAHQVSHHNKDPLRALEAECAHAMPVDRAVLRVSGADDRQSAGRGGQARAGVLAHVEHHNAVKLERQVPIDKVPTTAGSRAENRA
jgi:hypothetical protein